MSDGNDPIIFPWIARDIMREKMNENNRQRKKQNNQRIKQQYTKEEETQPTYANDDTPDLIEYAKQRKLMDQKNQIDGNQFQNLRPEQIISGDLNPQQKSGIVLLIFFDATASPEPRQYDEFKLGTHASVADYKDYNNQQELNQAIIEFVKTQMKYKTRSDVPKGEYGIFVGQLMKEDEIFNRLRFV